MNSNRVFINQNQKTLKIINEKTYESDYDPENVVTTPNREYGKSNIFVSEAINEEPSVTQQTESREVEHTNYK